MDEHEFSILGQAKATSVANPTAEMTKIMSNEFLKVFELKEYCKFIESDMKKFYKNMETLTAAKNESTKIMAEYKSRNKVNATNSESLLQALNELYKYKCELKSSYIAAQKGLKSKKLKYKKIISSYEFAWNKALKGYSAEPVCVELHEIEQENKSLEQEIQKQEKFFSCTKMQFIELKRISEKKFLEKIVNFSKAMVEYSDFLKSTDRNAKNEPLPDSKGDFEFTLFKREMPTLNRREAFSPDNNGDGNHICSFDITVFDDIMVPSENLESQNMEEDGYSPRQSDERPLSDVSKDIEEGNQQIAKAVLLYKKAAESSIENSVQDSKMATANENESQYFRTDALESARKVPGEKVKAMEQREGNKKNLNERTEKKGEGAEKLKEGGSVLQQTANVEEAPKDLQIESEESLSETSYEKQFGNQRAGNYEYQYPKTSSMSSDDLPGENLNENPGPSRLFYEQNADFRPRSQLKENDIKSFTGFFTMGNDQDTSKPSIFKLF